MTPLEYQIERIALKAKVPLGEPFWRNDLRNGVEADICVAKGFYYGAPEEEIEQDVGMAFENIDILDKQNFYTAVRRIGQDRFRRIEYEILADGKLIAHDAPDRHIRAMLKSAFHLGSAIEVVRASTYDPVAKEWRIEYPCATAPPCIFSSKKNGSLARYEPLRIANEVFDIITNARVDDASD